ncbi:hypothetical protein N9S30_00185 [bacterium]|nr:hypothetical protein [bacterium]
MVAVRKAKRLIIMTKIASSRESFVNLKEDSKKSKNALDKAWSVASKSAMMLQRPRTVGKGKSKKLATFVDRHGVEKPCPTRTLRTLKKHSLSVLLSGAFAEVAGITAEEAGTVKVDASGEKDTAPARPVMTAGAALLFEQAITAYAQSAFLSALEICEGMSMHSKVTTGAMMAACQITNQRIAAAGVTPTMQSNMTVWRRKGPVAKKKAAIEARGGDKIQEV